MAGIEPALPVLIWPDFPRRGGCHRLELRQQPRRGGRCSAAATAAGKVNFIAARRSAGGGLHLRGLQGRGRAEEEGREELHSAPAEGRAMKTFRLLQPRHVSERSRVQALSAFVEKSAQQQPRRSRQAPRLRFGSDAPARASEGLSCISAAMLLCIVLNRCARS